MHLTPSTLLLLSIPSTLATPYPPPLPCHGTCTNTHDPSLILRPDGTYFRFSTGSNISIHTAPTIHGPWTYNGPALPHGSRIQKPGSRDLWAPDVAFINTTYYLYYSVGSFASQDSAIGVAVSKTMESGSWDDLASTGIESVPGSEFNAIDGNLQLGDGGKLYMNFGSFWSDLFQVEMSATPTTIAEAITSATPIAFVPTPPQAQEAAFGYQYDLGLPPAGEEYKIQVCRSELVSGPFVDKNGKSCLEGGGTTVLESHGWVYGPGGQGIIDDPKLGPVLYYHYVDSRVGYSDGDKQFGLNKLSFSSGWPCV
ncbi:MAG: hypothetical protein Q9169_004778 [Polycauliona sp. 2 TL-2023]